jgi:tellurite resistance protein
MGSAPAPILGPMDDPGPQFVRDLSAAHLEALVETMYLVAFADGEYADAERAHFERCVQALTDGRMSGDSFAHVVDRVVGQLAGEGHDVCVESLKRRLDDPRLRQVALILATDMAAADGKLHDAERSLILSLADAFDMPPDSTREVLDGPA